MNELGKVWKTINTWAQELTKDLGESFDNNKYLGTRVNERLGGEFGLNFFQLIRDRHATVVLLLQ